jgi:serine/threonine protein kinase
VKSEGQYKVLGKGSYGEVELARVVQRSDRPQLPRELIGKFIAVKKIDRNSLRNKKIAATLLREVDIHRRIKHENIVRLYQAIDVKSNSRYLYLFLEYAEKGSLFHIIRNRLQSESISE